MLVHELERSIYLRLLGGQFIVNMNIPFQLDDELSVTGEGHTRWVRKLRRFLCSARTSCQPCAGACDTTTWQTITFSAKHPPDLLRLNSERLNHLRYKDQSNWEWTGQRSCQSIPEDKEAERRRRSSAPARIPPVRFLRRGSCHVPATVRIRAAVS